MKNSKYGFSDNPVHDELLFKLSQLAGEWKNTQDATVLRRYQACLLTLMELGWSGTLAPEITLPDEFMKWVEFKKLVAVSIKTVWKTVPGAFSHNPLYDALGEVLTRIRWHWGGSKDPNLVQRYSAVLLTLIELGWNEGLDVELELPDRLMPPEFFSSH